MSLNDKPCVPVKPLLLKPSVLL